MHADGTIMTNISELGTFLIFIDGDCLAVQPTAKVELECGTGSGDVEITFEAQGRQAKVMLDPDAALTLAESITFYANASKRIAAKADAKNREFDESAARCAREYWRNHYKANGVF
jgi:hypothetical protein